MRRDGVKTSVTCKKVSLYCYWTMGTHFEKRRLGESMNLATFAHNLQCTECDKMNVFLSVYCSVHVLDFDVEELDEYQVQSLPDHDKHTCQPSGIKQLLIVPSKGKKSANNPYGYLLIDSHTSSNLDSLCMLYFEEHVYGMGHYQSIRSVNNENFTKVHINV